MKKKILKLVAGATLVAAMVVGMEMNKSAKGSDINMANLISIAVADGEVVLDGCRKEDGEACNCGTVTAQDCDNSAWFQIDNCMYEM